MKNSKTTLFTLAMIAMAVLFQSCKNEDPDPITQIDLITASGNTITMTGNWLSPCAELDGNSIKEVFTFNGLNASIEIDFFSGSGCQGNPANHETINLQINDVLNTYSVNLDGVMVTANKIKGTESTVGEPGTDNFKQGFYIDDTGSLPVLYHGIFGDDGGTLTTDGYPLEMHNFGIVKQ
jgi:hypothetical protein